MKKTLRISTLALCLLLFTALVAGCGNAPPPLPQWANSEELRAKGEAAISDLNARDYSSLTLHFKEDYRALMSEELWAEQFDEVLDQLGAFEEITKIETQGIVNEQGEEFAAMLFTCKYENGALRYTLSFDSESDLVGFFIA